MILFNDVLLWTTRTVSFFKEKLKAVDVTQLCTIKDVVETADLGECPVNAISVANIRSENGFQIVKADGTSVTWVSNSPEGKKSWIDNLKFYAYQAKQSQGICNGTRVHVLICAI